MWLIVIPFGISFFWFFVLFFGAVIVFRIVIWFSKAIDRIKGIFK